MENLTPVGGFQNGYTVQKVLKSLSVWPQFLVCNHNCTHVVQIISHNSNNVEFELCEIEAKKKAELLQQVADGAYIQSDIVQKTGFAAKVVPLQHCLSPKFLICGHMCSNIIQLISNISQYVEFELCHIEAGKLATLILNSVSLGDNHE